MKSFTSTFMMVCILAIAAYDIWVILSVGSEESISAYFLALGEVTPFVPSLMGFTMGHLFWPRKSIIHTWDYNYLSIGFWMLFAPPALYDVYMVWSGGQLIFPNYELNHVYPFAFTFVLGHLLWPMNPKKWSGKFKGEK